MMHIPLMLRVAFVAELVFGVARVPRYFDAAGTGPLTHEVLLNLWTKVIQSEDTWKHFEVLEPYRIPFNETLPKGIYKKLSADVPRAVAEVVNGGKGGLGDGKPLTYDEITLRKVDDCKHDIDEEKAKYEHPESANKANAVEADIVVGALKLRTNAYSMIMKDMNTFFMSETCARVCEDLSRHLGSANCFANWYVSPVASCAHSLHLDIEENYVVQLSGAKRWTFYNTTRIAPSFDLCLEEDCESYYDRMGSVIGKGKMSAKNVTLYPGDLLYFPRGLIHEAGADYPDLKRYGQYSSHVTFAVATGLSWSELLVEVLRAREGEDPELKEDLLSPACASSAVQSDVAVEIGADASAIYKERPSWCPDILAQEKLSWHFFIHNFIDFAARLKIDLRRSVVRGKESTALFASRLLQAVSALRTLLMPNATHSDDPKVLGDGTQHLIVKALKFASSQDGRLSKAVRKIFRKPKQLSKELQLRKGAWLDNMQYKLWLKLDAVFMGVLISEKSKKKGKAFSAKVAAVMKEARKKVDKARTEYFQSRKREYNEGYHFE